MEVNTCLNRPCLDSETSCTTSSSNSLYTLLHHSHRPKTFLSPSVHTLLVNDLSTILNDSVPAIIDSSTLSLNWSAIETFISDNIQNGQYVIRCKTVRTYILLCIY